MLKVDTVCMETQAQKMKDIASRLDQISSDLSTVSQNLQWKSGVDFRVRRSLNASKNTVNGMAQKAATLEQLLNQAITEYTNSENAAKTGNTDSPVGIGVQVNPRIIHVVGPGGQLKYLDDSGNSNDSSDPKIPNWIQPLLKLVDKLDSDGEAGLLDKVISYMDAVRDVFSGDTGGDDFLNLFDKSIDAWTEYYDYLKNLYKGKDGIFSDSSKKKVDGLGLGGDALGFIADLWGANETISQSPNMGVSGKIGEYVGASDNLVDMGEDVLEMILGKEHALTKKDGVYSPLFIYSAITKAGMDAVSQTLTSIDKYNDDGKLDMGDIGSIGIDMGMAGLYAISHTLTFGLDDAIFEKVDELTGGDKNDNRNYAQKAADGYKLLAEQTGKAIGDWWRSLKD